MNEPFNSEVPQSYSAKEVSQESSLVKTIKKLIKGILIVGGFILLIPFILFVFCMIMFIPQALYVGNVSTGIFGIIFAIGVISLIIGFRRKKKLNKPTHSKQNYLLLTLVGITFVFLFAMGQSDVESFSCPVHYDFYYMVLPLLQMSLIAITGVNFFSMIFSKEEKINYRK